MHPLQGGGVVGAHANPVGVPGAPLGVGAALGVGQRGEVAGLLEVGDLG
jgi:hypothetical protein